MNVSTSLVTALEMCTRYVIVRHTATYETISVSNWWLSNHCVDSEHYLQCHRDCHSSRPTRRANDWRLSNWTRDRTGVSLGLRHHCWNVDTLQLAQADQPLVTLERL